MSRAFKRLPVGVGKGTSARSQQFSVIEGEATPVAESGNSVPVPAQTDCRFGAELTTNIDAACTEKQRKLRQRISCVTSGKSLYSHSLVERTPCVRTAFPAALRSWWLKIGTSATCRKYSVTTGSFQETEFHRSLSGDEPEVYQLPEYSRRPAVVARIVSNCGCRNHGKYSISGCLSPEMLSKYCRVPQKLALAVIMLMDFPFHGFDESLNFHHGTRCRSRLPMQPGDGEVPFIR